MKKAQNRTARQPHHPANASARKAKRIAQPSPEHGYGAASPPAVLAVLHPQILPAITASLDLPIGPDGLIESVSAKFERLNEVQAVHRTICGRWVYRQNRQYVAFLGHARATRQATLRKFRDEGFRAWLLWELRSRTVRRAASEAAKHGGNGYPSRNSACLPLPFDEVPTAEKPRAATANRRRAPKRRCG